MQIIVLHSFVSKTDAGKRRIAEAKTIHGKDTRLIREKRRELSRELYELEMEGVITGSKTVGRKPKKIKR
jgi:hypothetical protein